MILLKCIDDTNCTRIRKGKKYNGYVKYDDLGVQIGWDIPNIYNKYPIRCFTRAYNIPKNIKTV
jgi:hypothetical protein